METPCSKRIKVDAMEHEVPSEFTIHPEMAWNDEMTAFYNDAHGVNTKMDLNETATQWTGVSHSSPKERTKCAMCGSAEHATASCPSSCCLKCGKETDTFQDECAACLEWSSAICKICGEQGHSKNDCPDHWRCYHSTIDSASPMQYSMIEDPRNFRFKWDSNGNAGHGQFYQRFLNDTMLPNVPIVTNSESYGHFCSSSSPS